MKERMDKKLHLEYLREKYIELNQQFVKELQDGKSIIMLRDLSSVIHTLQQEIEALEEIHTKKDHPASPK